jgi:hypothetical protein
MAMTRREFLGNSLAVGTMSLVSHLDLPGDCAAERQKVMFSPSHM